MKNENIIYFFLLFLFLFLNIEGKVHKPIWIKNRTEKGVSIYSAKINDRIAFRGIGEISGKPEKLISIIENPFSWKNWIKNFRSGKLIEKKGPDHKIFYQAINSPFPFSNRDMVYESKIYRNTSKIIRLEMKSVEHKRAPKTIGVRINIFFTNYIIETINEEKMKVTFETFSAPGGIIPNFLVEWVGESYPITLFEGLRTQLKNR